MGPFAVLVCQRPNAISPFHAFPVVVIVQGRTKFWEKACLTVKLEKMNPEMKTTTKKTNTFLYENELSIFFSQIEKQSNTV